jgi:acylphosphatase
MHNIVKFSNHNKIESMKARAHVYVSGRVTGVFFRYETQTLAEELGVKGWVRNTPDGRVEAIFEGEKELVEQMLDFCRRGPPGARVTDIKVNWEPYKGEFSGFSIRYG